MHESDKSNEMRFLAISDLHGEHSYVKALLDHAGEIDAVLIAGDITDFGPVERASELMDMFDLPLFAVPGNCDPEGIIKILDSRAVNLHRKHERFGEIDFVGLGGSNPTPFNTPFEIPEENIYEYMQEITGTCCENKKTVLLSHAPPRNTLDRVPSGNVGSESIAHFLDRFDLVVCGHIHESAGIMDVKGTKIVNPGPAFRGRGALIEIGCDIKIELLHVDM